MAVIIRLIRYKSPRSPRGPREGGNRRFSRSNRYVHLIRHHHPVSSSLFPSLARSGRAQPSTTRLLGDTNDTASRAGASVASLLALLVAALAQVVGAGVDNNGAAKDALGADQLDELVGDGAVGVALGVGLEVAQVADVALAVGGSTVGLVVRVDCGGERC